MKSTGFPERTHERGSTMIEAAFVLVPLLTILLGIIDFSVALFMKNTMQFAVRQGVRYAVTSQTLNGQGQDASIKTIVKQNSMGFLTYLSGNTDPMSHITINYYDPATLKVVNGAGSNRGGNIVQISISGLSWLWMVPLGHGNAPLLPIAAASADVMEASPNGIPPNR